MPGKIFSVAVESAAHLFHSARNLLTFQLLTMAARVQHLSAIHNYRPADVCGAARFRHVPAKIFVGCMDVVRPKGVCVRAPALGVLIGCCLILIAVGCGGSPPPNSVTPTTNSTSTAAYGAPSGAPSGAAVSPVTSAQLVANPASLNFGSVQVGTSATQSLVLSNTGTANASISSLTATDPAFRVIVPALPFTLSAGYSVTSQVQFVPAGAGNLSATLTVAAVGAPTLTVGLAGTGMFPPAPTPTPTPGQHLATLAWGASSSVVDGYNVYRGSTSGGPYTRLNSAPVTALSFGDTNVTAGQTYFYVVTAMAAGAESAYSNEAQAVIPSP